MDKYEYRIRAEEINSLIEQQEYAEAVKIADTIDWRRVRSVVMLCKVSELYKMNRRYEDSKEVLLLAYDLQPGSRKIIYSLCELSIKLEETVQAVEYYKEFVQIAPRDTGRFILQYRLYEAQDVSLEERIAVLEEYKKRDYREKWAYELAYLYHRIGLATRCVEECDELILWFGEGKYVLKAMELKMLHAPLTLQQQEKYNARFLSEMEAIAAVEEESRAQEEIPPFMPIEIKSIEATKAKTAEIPAKQIRGGAQSEQEQDDPEQTKEMPVRIIDEEENDDEAVLSDRLVIEEIAEQDAAYPAAGEDSDEPLAQASDESDVCDEDNAPQEDADMKIVHSVDDLDIHVKTIDVDDEYSTINLQEALAKDLAQLFAQEDMEASDATKALPIGSLAAASELLSQGVSMPVEAVSLQGQAAKEPEEIFFQEAETEPEEETKDTDDSIEIKGETGDADAPIETEEETDNDISVETEEEADSDVPAEIGEEADSDVSAEIGEEADSDVSAAIREGIGYAIEPQPIDTVVLPDVEETTDLIIPEEIEEESKDTNALTEIEEETSSDIPVETEEEAGSDIPAETEEEADSDVPTAIEEEIRYVAVPLPDNEEVLLQEAEAEPEEESASVKAEETADRVALAEIVEKSEDADVPIEIEEKTDNDISVEIGEEADSDVSAAIREGIGYAIEPQPIDTVVLPDVEETTDLIIPEEIEEESKDTNALTEIEEETSSDIPVETEEEAGSDIPAETEEEADSDVPTAIEEEIRYVAEPLPDNEEVFLQEAEEEADSDIPVGVEEETGYEIEPQPIDTVVLPDAEEMTDLIIPEEIAEESEDTDALTEIEEETSSDIPVETEEEAGSHIPVETEEEASSDIPTAIEEEIRYVVEPLPDNEEALLQEVEAALEEELASAKAEETAERAEEIRYVVEPLPDNEEVLLQEAEAPPEEETDNTALMDIEEPVVQETQPPRELEPLIFSNNAPLPEALIQAMQTVAIEAAKEAALAAAKEAAKETASAFQAMQPETVKEGPAVKEVIEPQKEKPEEAKPEQTVEKQITGQLSFTDIMGEWEKTKKANEEKHLEEMKQRVMEQTGPLLSDFDSLTMTNSQDELTMLSPMLDVFSETEDLANEVEQAIAEETQEAARGSYADGPAVAQTIWPDVQPQQETEKRPDIQPQPETQERPDMQLFRPEPQEQPDVQLFQPESRPDIQPRQPELQPQPQTEKQPDIQPQQNLQEQPDDINHVEDRPNIFNTAEINGLEEKLMTALSDQHYETSDMQVAALSAELSAQKAQNPQSVDVQQVRTPVSDSPRFLTKTEKELFGTIAQTRQLQQKLAASLDAISMNPVSGNVIVTGEKGVGALEIAQRVAGYLAQERPHFTGNIQTYTFEDLKRKDIIATLDALAGGVMIIDQAGDLTQQACVTVTNALQNMSGKGIVIILVDTKADIDRLQRSFARLNEFFTVAIDITTLDNNGLVNFGKEYAKQQDYSIDTMGVLALHNRIEERQTVDHAVTVEEVKGIVNEAIQSAEKKNVSHFMDVIFAKRYDKDDMVVLHEKDFLNEK